MTAPGPSDTVHQAWHSGKPQTRSQTSPVNRFPSIPLRQAHTGCQCFCPNILKKSEAESAHWRRGVGATLTGWTGQDNLALSRGEGLGQSWDAVRAGCCSQSDESISLPAWGWGDKALAPINRISSTLFKAPPLCIHMVTTALHSTTKGGATAIPMNTVR